MSAAGRAVRRENDAYYTPDVVAQACARALVPHLPTPHPHGGPDLYVCEPSVGGGAFVRALRQLCPMHIVGVDVDPGVHGATECDVFVQADWPQFRPVLPFDLIVGNVPYSHAEAHVRHALAMVSHGGVVAFLLRLAFLEGQARRAFWDEHRPLEVHVLSKRPSFTGGGTDSAAYAFFLWKRGHQGETRMGWL